MITNATSPSHTMLTVRVHAVRAEACDVLSLDLRPVAGAASGDALPAFTAGSHIDLEVPVQGQVALRQYSLSNSSAERHRYVVGVGRDANSRGGSVAVHDKLRVGDTLRISAPRNNFPLAEAAAHSVLVAGGIGITPMLAMVRRLTDLGKPWTLYYCVRTPSRAAFIDELVALTTTPNAAGQVITVFDGMPGVARLDIAAVVREAPAGSHFYCCGPVPMMKAFEAATSACDDGHVHVEWFSAPAAAQDHAAADGSFNVQLKRKGRSFTVPADKSILEVLLDGGVDVDYSCREGLCGTCETRVLAGVPDHRDPILAGKKDPPLNKIMVCVSRCAGPELVLDL
jgi:ferredoxin-NADP reductase